MRLRRLVVALAACSPTTPPPRPIEPPPPPPACEPEVSVPSTAAIACDAAGSACGAPVPIVVRACDAPVDVTLQPFALCVEGPRSPVHVEPHASATFVATAHGAGSRDIQLAIATTRPKLGSTCDAAGRCRPLREREAIEIRRSDTVAVSDPVTDAAYAACVACNGDWGPHGMMQQVTVCGGGDATCNCRTRDAGMPCRDGDACQGWCERERFVTTGHRRGVAIGHEEGRCSEFVEQYSCVHPIASGASKLPEHPFEESQVCID